MIKQIHVDECDSTQDLLKEQLISHSNQEQFLISCNNQIKGRGRGNNTWTSTNGTLCFSMNIGPHPIQSFTAIEISVIVAQFFEFKNKKLKLKWPNDLWNEQNKKCAGILIQGSQNTLLAGIGVNLFSEDHEFGGVFEKPFEFNKALWSLELANYILKNRISSTSELKNLWLNRCGHLDKTVQIIEGVSISEGTFLGLGEFGEALIRNEEGLHRHYNGSLRLT
jgi:BirA family transcriptional regulator, biotin operon repressor / biotin---[acetyl-CoA-carboxylase] ligase